MRSGPARKSGPPVLPWRPAALGAGSWTVNLRCDSFCTYVTATPLADFLTCVALACTGLPAHACADAAEAETEALVEENVAESAAPCPHHPPPASEAVTNQPDSTTEGGDSSCCGLDCSCRCGATAPAITLLPNTAAENHHGAKVSFSPPLAPSLSPERLLRPPIPSA